MFTHIRSSAPNMFAKFGWKTRTFCHKKVAKVIAKLESARLYICNGNQETSLPNWLVTKLMRTQVASHIRDFVTIA